MEKKMIVIFETQKILVKSQCYAIFLLSEKHLLNMKN